MDNLIIKAAHFAAAAHSNQFRKYSQKPYIVHPAAIASRVILHSEANENMVCAAWLHDTVEDTLTTYNQIEEKFNKTVRHYVEELTKKSIHSSLPREKRWKIDLEKYSNISRQAKIIKLFDRECNLEDYMWDFSLLNRNEVKFLNNIYLPESRELLEKIGRVDEEISYQVNRNINNLQYKVDLELFHWKTKK